MHNHSVTNNQLDATCAVLEALAFYSEATTLKAYYNLNLQGKLSRDNESRRVLDLIFSTFTYDFIESYRWSNMFDVVCSSIEDPSTFISKYITGESAMTNDMKDTYTYYISNNSEAMHHN